jgi:hypothetical protein
MADNRAKPSMTVGGRGAPTKPTAVVPLPAVPLAGAAGEADHPYLSNGRQ